MCESTCTTTVANNVVNINKEDSMYSDAQCALDHELHMLKLEMDDDIRTAMAIQADKDDHMFECACGKLEMTDDEYTIAQATHIAQAKAHVHARIRPYTHVYTHTLPYKKYRKTRTVLVCNGATINGVYVGSVYMKEANL